MNNQKLIGFCGVDSGQILLTDPCYLSNWKDDEPFKKNKKKTKGNYSYSGACDITCDDNQAGQLKNENGAQVGVVATTGLGDGVYPVYAEYQNEGEFGKRIKSLTIKFL